MTYRKNVHSNFYLSCWLVGRKECKPLMYYSMTKLVFLQAIILFQLIHNNRLYTIITTNDIHLKLIIGTPDNYL